MNLAHQTPQTRKINDTELFRWNYIDTTQFVLVDPDSTGWTLMFVPVSGPTPAHLVLRPPKIPKSQTSPVYLLIKTDVGPDHTIHAVHDVPSSGMAGVVDRYAGPDEFLATLHATTLSRMVLSENGTAKTLIKLDHSDSTMVAATSEVYLGLVQLKVAGVSGVCLDEGGESLRSGRAGFMLYAPGNLSEPVRLFDICVERTR
jgi:hypothetical protein